MKAVEWEIFPLDRQLELWEKHWSAGVAKEAVWLSGVVGSYEAAEAVMSRVGKIKMSDSTLWRRVEKWGQRFLEVEQQQRQQATRLPVRNELLRPEQQQPGRKGVAMDGAMVHILQEGWKELKVGCVFELEVRPTFDKERQAWSDLAHASNNSYVAHLGGPELFGQLLWSEAQSRGWEQHFETQVIGDGALWIWNLAQQHFFDSRQTVDWYHASQHLYSAAQVYYPDEPTRTQRWFDQAETTLFQGQAEQIAQTLRTRATQLPQAAETLNTEAAYFENNKRRMNYLEDREEGYLIGSGMVESGAKQFKARFCGPGMRWSRPGLERLIPIRAVILSHSFDTLWPKVYNSPPI